MRTLPLFLAFLLLLSPALAFAQNATEAGQLPPSVPQSAGPVAVKAVLANGSSPIGMPVVIMATSGNATTTYRLITGREGSLLLQLGNGDYQLDSVLDDISSAGADYASTASLLVPAQQNLTLIFYPAGSAAVSVIEGGSVVPGADMHLSCSSDWFDYSAINGMKGARAGEAGDFLFRALPAGTCVISASTQSSAGSARVAIEQGNLANVQLELRPKALSLPDMAQLAVAIVVAAALMYLIFAKKPAAAQASPEGAKAGKKSAAREKRQARQDAPPATKQAAHAPQAEKQAAHAPSALGANSEKARAVLSTLSEREADIVRFLMSAGGKSKRSTMQHKLLIPKTSLLRNLRALERKNIVKLIPFGRNMVAELQRNLFE